MPVTLVMQAYAGMHQGLAWTECWHACVRCTELAAMTQDAVESRNLPKNLADLIVTFLKLKYQFTGLTYNDGLWQDLPYAMVRILHWPLWLSRHYGRPACQTALQLNQCS